LETQQANGVNRHLLRNEAQAVFCWNTNLLRKRSANSFNFFLFPVEQFKHRLGALLLRGKSPWASAGTGLALLNKRGAAGRESWDPMGSLIAVLGTSSRALFQAVGWKPSMRLISGGRFDRLATLLALLSRSDEDAEALLAEKLDGLQTHTELTPYEQRVFDRIRDLMQLRALSLGKRQRGKARIRQGFMNRSLPDSAEEIDWSLQDITESATVVAELYSKLLDTCLGTFPELKELGHSLFP
jgi:hypothetical protein